jgi:hypothetical protein
VPADLRLVAAAVDEHTTARRLFTQALLALVEQLVRGFGAGGALAVVVDPTPPASTGSATFAAWYADTEVAGLAAQLAGWVEATQRTVAASSDAYLASVAGELAGTPYSPVGQVDPATLRRGTGHADAYARLARQFRYEVAQGAQPEAALEHVVTRAAVMAEWDVALADRAQVERFAEAREVEGYRRIVRPELSESGVCGLCVAASDRVYKRGDLVGLHGRCKCIWLPIVNGQDPGRTLNRDDLDELYRRADGSTDRAKLARVRYTEQEHAELGAVLAVDGQHFRSSEDVQAAAA